MNIQAMMKQAQKLQKEMMETKKIIDETVFTGESSFVKVSVYGNKKIKEIMIEEKDLSSDDIEMLQDMIVVAINDAMNKIDKETEKKFRVRQNVVLELGMLLSLVGRSRVAILLSQSENMERPSDIDGLIYIPFKENVEEAKLSLAKEMNNNGYTIGVDKL